MSVYIKEKAEYFQACMDSIFSQTRLPDEIVLVEDGPVSEELSSLINMENQEREKIELLDYLYKKTGCRYLSDLSYLSPRRKLRDIQRVVRKLDPEAFSLWEWNDAVTYITGEPVSFRSKEAAVQYLLNEQVDDERK